MKNELQQLLSREIYKNNQSSCSVYSSSEKYSEVANIGVL